jgi:hypothetical protein
MLKKPPKKGKPSNFHEFQVKKLNIEILKKKNFDV